MNQIKIMSTDLANKIAAGEVVERCMNVVKELVENSIDAFATEIKIDLIDSGIKQIKVIDNGKGMNKSDAKNAFLRHATSKLSEIDDLFNITSLGFRGEALPSVASVSQVNMKTSDGKVGTELTINGGVIEDIKESDLRRGTIITINNLFYNTPVRLKFLKNPYIELTNILDYVNKMALSYPRIKFKLSNNNKLLLNTDGSDRLLKVINDIYGLAATKKMIEIKAENNDYAISGYISYPEIVKGSAKSITVLVNGRVIKNNEIIKIIKEAYHTYIAENKYPIVIINIDVDPILIDVNIHPTKSDIKFSKFDNLKELIFNTINNKLKTFILIPEIKEVVFNQEEIKKTLDIVSEPVKLAYPNIEEITLDLEINESSTILKEEPLTNRIKEIYPVGLVHGTYIIGENENGMYIIDQHAAAERINYERYLKELTDDKKDMINLLIPLNIELSSNEFIILKEHFHILKDLGIEVEEFGVNTLVVRSHPVWLPKNNEAASINHIIDIIINKGNFNKTKFIEQVAITLACKLSIKANENLTIADMQVVIDKLRQTANPFTCPHGRPTIVSYSKYELEKLFKRSV
jgi:DNA mismatch repair protein MutL